MAYLNSKPILSITIPTWNRAATLDKALEHLLPQIKAYSKEIEIIVSDNASVDNTSDIVNKHISNNPELSIIYNRNEVNVGFFGNFKKCRELATGEYMWLLSDDDFVCDKVISVVIAKLVTDVDCAMIYLKNDSGSDIFKSAAYTMGEIIRNENYSIGLISSVVFLNTKDNDTWLFDKYPGAPFIGFIFLLNSFNFKNRAEVIEGNCLLLANAVPKGYNFFDVFINGMDEVIEYMYILKIPKKLIDNFRSIYLTKFIRPVYISFKNENAISFGNFEVSTIKKVNTWLYKSYGDLWSFWMLFYPAIILPSFVSTLAVKFKRAIK